MKKFLFTSDIVNCNENVYLSIKDNEFELYEFPLRGDFMKCICKIIEKFKYEHHTSADVIYIPFIPYNNFLSKNTLKKQLYFGEIIKTYGVSIQTMEPDSLKGVMAPTK